MWAIKVLTGPQAGQIFKLKVGKNRLGRAEGQDIQVQANGISKEHFEIQLGGDKLLLLDLKSSNGTFVNGVRIQTAVLKLGDRISAHQSLFELINTQEVLQIREPLQTVRPVAAPLPAASLSWLDRADSYLQTVLLPGVYGLTDVFSYRSVLLGFAVVFILLVTILSVLPMKQITSESIQIESRRRAQTVARALAGTNERIIRSGDLSNFSVDFVLREDGIDDVYIVSKEGVILAPPERAGSRPRDTKFINQIKGQTKEIAETLSSELVAASYPILSFDPEMQQNVPRAYAVVIFNVGSLQFDDGRALSLFVQMLTIAVLVGFCLFYFVFKLVEYPLSRLNQELDLALRERRDHIQVPMRFPVLQQVLVNLNSALNRIHHNGQETASFESMNRDPEMINMVNLIGYPAMIINRQETVLSFNSGLETLLGGVGHLFGRPISELPDQALQKNIQELIARARQNMGQIQTDQLEMAGHPLSIHCQCLVDQKGEPDYFIVTFSPQETYQGGAA